MEIPRTPSGMEQPNFSSCALTNCVRILGVFPSGWSGLGLKPTACFHLVSRLSVSVVVSQGAYLPWWRAQGPLLFASCFNKQHCFFENTSLLCVPYDSRNEPELLPYTALTSWSFYCRHQMCILWGREYISNYCLNGCKWVHAFSAHERKHGCSHSILSMSMQRVIKVNFHHGLF
jgi:hypothetical protein